MEEKSTRLIYNRIKSAYGLKTDIDLANLLKITPQAIATSIARDSINWERIFTECKDISVDWLLTGNGKMFGVNFPPKNQQSEKTIEKLHNYIDLLENQLLKTNKELETLKKMLLKNESKIKMQ